MQAGTKLLIGEVVQLAPEPGVCTNPVFAGCLLVVTELKSFGCMGYVQVLGENGKPGGQAYYRPRWNEMELLRGSCAPWRVE